MKCYLYLVQAKDKSKFKVGYTAQKDPRLRLRHYISHNPDTIILGYWEVPNKMFEKNVYYELRKNFTPVNIKGQNEWFCGDMTELILKKIIEKEVVKHNNYQESK